MPTETPPPPSPTEAAPTVAPAEAETPTAAATVEETVEPTATALDVSDAELVTTVNVTGAPAGPLLLAANGSGFVFTGSSGEAVSNMNGGVDALGPADALVWSPGGNYVLYANYPNGQSAIATLNWNTDEIVQVTTGTDGVDVPAGWLGDRIYYLRTFPDRPGTAELHSATPEGNDDTVVWTGENVAPAGQRPVATGGGILIPMQSSWLLVSPGGDARNMGANPYGAVTAPTLSPGGSLIAYLTGGQVIVASVNSPGAAIAAIPSAGSFDWSPNGEQLVVTDGSGISIYTSGGAPIMSIANSSGVGIAAAGWTSDGIYLLESNPTTGLFLLPTSALNG
jgi:Tol biopolymer transport system component